VTEIAAWPTLANIQAAARTTLPWPITTSSDKRPRRRPPRRAPPEQGRSKRRGVRHHSCKYLYKPLLFQKPYLYKQIFVLVLGAEMAYHLSKAQVFTQFQDKSLKIFLPKFTYLYKYTFLKKSPKTAVASCGLG
jgi:hypothetical protein